MTTLTSIKWITRLLDCTTSGIRNMNAREILKSIKLCEGRVITQQISLFGETQLLPPVSDAENLMHYSEVIRGKHHTILRMARSIYR